MILFKSCSFYACAIIMLSGCENQSAPVTYKNFQPGACECRDWAAESYAFLDSTERAVRYFNTDQKELYPKKIADLKNGAKRFDSLLNVCIPFLHERVECTKPYFVKGYFEFSNYFFSDPDTSLFLKYDRLYTGDWRTDSLQRAFTKHDRKMIDLIPRMMIDSSLVSVDDRHYFDSAIQISRAEHLNDFQKMLDYSDSMHPCNRMHFRKTP